MSSSYFSVVTQLFQVNSPVKIVNKSVTKYSEGLQGTKEVELLHKLANVDIIPYMHERSCNCLSLFNNYIDTTKIYVNLWLYMNPCVL